MGLFGTKAHCYNRVSKRLYRQSSRGHDSIVREEEEVEVRFERRE